MGAMSPWHWAIVLIVLVLLFGSTRLPGAARGLGKSLRIFKSEMKEMTGDEPSGSRPDTASESAPGHTTTPQALPPQQPSTPAQPAVAPQTEARSVPASAGTADGAAGGAGGNTPQAQSSQQPADPSGSTHTPEA